MGSDRFIFEIIEQTIIDSEFTEYYLFNKKLDFKINDIVECSYIQGIFYVVSVHKDYLHLKCLNRFEEINFLVGKMFLKKIKVDKKTLEVLYGFKLR